MGALARVLERHGVDLTEADVASAFDAALSGIPQAAPLTDAEVRFLGKHGGATAAAATARWDPEREHRERGLAAARDAQRLLTGSLSVREAALMVGLDRSSVQKRVASRRVYAFQMPERRQWRIPRWQILGVRLLPGIGTVIPAIPTSLPPLSVEAFMLTAQEELEDRSPVEFLAAAGSPQRVADLAAELDEW
jgi:hypothetical protein